MLKRKPGNISSMPLIAEITRVTKICLSSNIEQWSDTKSNEKKNIVVCEKTNTKILVYQKLQTKYSRPIEKKIEIV